MPDELLTKKSLFDPEPNYKNYGASWISKTSPQFIAPQKMWDLLDEILLLEKKLSLKDLKSDFEFLKQIRNKHFHGFLDGMAPKSFYLIKYNAWFVLIRLLKALPDDLSVSYTAIIEEIGLSEDDLEKIENCDSDEKTRELLSAFSENINALSHARNDNERRGLLLRKLYSAEYLEEDVPQYDVTGEPAFVQGEDDEAIPETKSRISVLKAWDVQLDCPICLKDHYLEKTGYLGIENGGETYDVDSEGDATVWAEPIDVDVTFNHFYCIHCGCASAERYLLEKIGYGDVFENTFGISWDINRGITGFHVDDGGGFEITS